MPSADQNLVYGIVLGKLVALRRERLGLSQGALADQVGVRQATISRIESGQIPDALTLHRIAQALNTDANTLHAEAERGVRRMEEAAQPEDTAVPWGQLAAALGAVALGGLAVWVVARLLSEDREGRR